MIGVDVAAPTSVGPGAARLVAEFAGSAQPEVQLMGARLTSTGIELSLPPDAAAHRVASAAGQIVRVASPSGGLARHARLSSATTVVDFSQLSVVDLDSGTHQEIGFPGAIVSAAADGALETCALVFDDHTIRFGRLAESPETWHTIHHETPPSVAVSQRGDLIAVAWGEELQYWRPDGTSELPRACWTR